MPYSARVAMVGTTWSVREQCITPKPVRYQALRKLIHDAFKEAGITKRVYPHLFRHQLMTYLTKQGIISPKLQLLSGHAVEQSLAVYRALALSDVVDEYEAAMQHFPVR